jgi:subtilisin family serine protease
MKNIHLALALILPASSFASTIAIIDSGTDYKHKELAGQYLVNKDVVADNKKDDDKNGAVDDVYGYNFAEQNAQVIDYKYLDRLKPSMPEIHKLFEVQVRVLDGSATQEDKDWIKSKKDDKAFLKELQVFGNFAHGSHVAGITAGLSTSPLKDNHPFAVKLIPTEVKLPFSVQYARSETFRKTVEMAKGGIPTSLKEFLLSIGLKFFATQQSKIFSVISKYVDARKSDVANGSFGTGFEQAKMIVGALYNMVFTKAERSEAKLNEFTMEFMQHVLIASRQLVVNAPNTLFVFAAGNDGSNNDIYPSSPANLREDNTITVAATLRNRELASFSNFGNKVDVAAPGVGISSAYPGDDRGLMSGTSQAAPYVTGVAAEIKNRNPALKPVEIKAILTGTVDTKVWLVGKVLSSGIVNPDRAFVAAELSKEMSVYEAVTASRIRVKDMETEEMPSRTGRLSTISAADALLVRMPSPIE